MLQFTRAHTSFITRPGLVEAALPFLIFDERACAPTNTQHSVQSMRVKVNVMNEAPAFEFPAHIVIIGLLCEVYAELFFSTCLMCFCYLNKLAVRVAFAD